ncbi:SbcC/MukB-like Walker B domain-containing protein [Gilvimarinus sp. SDUM040013]|uniref:SbcC/MukB-like Walker B domain-containing protein n=1 Tax=Gilvimarinus gilvus TaxID=3058038 RepID=A0ABU4RW63_9GAMM|nr:SbcC/MukB-like Walker B domain-containing protein [Gilvimarinus sp. SDUM040013]MDO3386544.1 SbcC/MukB-like Walker B domain-containing protein [Gilvimarinus sp. SDUM040013]MDX6849120.1 SbcC/MukB-like Walker B domain-containing protein [Gilvimarinus sp. SDUM040013]
MFLKRGIFVNWGNIPQLEFEFGPINLFSGGNGSGKTTAADAIQTLMTAAHENLFNYNPGQDETTQRGRGGKQVRTLASYVLGCDDGSYARPWTVDGYVAGIFHPTQGEGGEPFTAVMCVRAHLDSAGSQKQARLDTLEFLIVPGEQLSLSHFVKSYPDGKHVVPITDIVTLLKKEFGASGIEQYDKKGAYLRRLYGALRGRKDAVSDREAKHAARTFANFMAYKPVKSITEFVAREILEPRDLGDAIRNVADLMKTIHQMESDTRAIRDAIVTLESARDCSTRYVDAWVERQLAEYSEATRLTKVNQRGYLSAKAEQKNILEQITANEVAQRDSEDRRRAAHESQVALEAQRQGISALKSKDDLEQTIADRTRELAGRARPVHEQSQQMQRNVQATEQLLQLLSQSSLGVDVPTIDGKAFRQLGQKVVATADQVAVDLAQLVNKDWVGIEQLESDVAKIKAAESAHSQWADTLHSAALSANGESVRSQIAHLLMQAERKRQDLNGKLKQRQRDVALLQTQKVNYPPYVEAALQAIHQAIPEAEPCVLCDYVNVLDANWQMAIEGYLGGARFSILVEPAYEAEAMRLVRSMPGARRNKARVIQGEKARRDAERWTAPSGSIIDVMAFDHKVAEYYLRASYGNVLRVDDAQTLRGTARGITPEGLGSGNYSMWRCDLDDSELVFGQHARERALKAKLRECEQLLADANHSEQAYQQLARVIELMDAIAQVQAGEAIAGMMDCHRAIQSAEKALAQLDLSDFNELEAELTQLKAQYQEEENRHRALVEDAGKLKERERTMARQVGQLADAQDALAEAQDDAEQAVYLMADHYPELDVDNAIGEACHRAEQAAENFTFADDIAALKQQLESHERALHSAIMQHNQRCHMQDSIVYDTGMGEPHGIECFRRVLAMGNEVVSLFNRFKNNVLVDKHEQLAELRDSFNTAFVTNLCHSIYQAVKDGERTLTDLNKELEYHRFGADRERFYFGYDWVPEFKDYWRFFTEVIAVPNLGDGTSLFDAELSVKACQVRDRMLDMLLDKDEQVALRELSRISDYRNYRYYEIYKEPEGKAAIALSQYGTGSGGQLETPAYIIRSAAVTSAFRFNEGDSHLRMVLVDEAFSKMDENRSREVIHYLTQTLGLQLLFIMPSSKSGPFMDLISNQFVFSKCPTAQPMGELKSRVLVDRKACDQEKIRKLWQNHRKTVRHQAMLDFMDTFEA